MHNWDWAIHNRDAHPPQPARNRSILAAAIRGSPAAAARGRRRAAPVPPPRRGKRGLRVHIAGRGQVARWPAAPRPPAESGGPGDRRVGYRRRRRPAADTTDGPAQEDRPEAAGRPGQAGSTAPKPPLPTLRDRSVASRWHQPCGKPFPLPLTQPCIKTQNKPQTKHIQYHRRKKMTNLLINPALWNPPRFNDLAGSDVGRPDPSRLLALAQYRFGQAEAVHADRDPAVDRDLRQHCSDFIGREPVAERAANVGLEFLHVSERGDHAEIEDRALARAQRVVAPGFTPTILGDDALEIAVEVIGALERAIDIVCAEHLAAHAEAAVIGVLIHGIIPPVCARGRQAPRAGFRLRVGERRRRTSPHRLRHWHARLLRAMTFLPRAATERRVRASPPAAGARRRARPL